MIFIVVKFKVLDKYRNDWLLVTQEFTDATDPSRATSGSNGITAQTIPPNSC